MLLIIAHHYVVNSGLTDAGGVIYANPLSWRSLFLLLFGAWGKTGINCFVMITGYFMCQSKITATKFFKLLFVMQFYRITFYCVFLFTGYAPFSLKTLVKTLLPITSVSADFGACYLLFYLCIPFLNILIRNMTEQQHLRLIALLGFIYVFFGTVPKLHVSMNYVSWFCVVYIIASYLRLYPKAAFENTRLCGLLALASWGLSAVSVVLCTWLGDVLGKNIAYVFVADSNNFLAFTNGIFAFLLFKNLKVPQSQFINKVAASTYGVLLIHANSDTMRQWLWRDMLDNVGAYASPYMPLHAMGSVLAIFAVATLIDFARIRFVERPVFAFAFQRRQSFSS